MAMFNCYVSLPKGKINYKSHDIPINSLVKPPYSGYTIGKTFSKSHIPTCPIRFIPLDSMVNSYPISHMVHMVPRRWRDVSPADPPPSIAPVPHLPPPPSHRHQGSCRGATGSPGNPPSFAVPTFKGTRAEVEGFLIIRIHIDIVSVYISKAIEVYLLAWNLNMSIYIYI